MKRIIYGVTYNTETSTRIAEQAYEDHEEKESHSDVLYQTHGGAFFVVYETVKQAWNQRDEQHEERIQHTFDPMSQEDAHKWMMEGEVEVFNNPFDEPPEATAEAEPGATLYIRVPASLKRRVDDAAKEAKASGNVWAMRCVERCLNPSPDAKEELALAYDILLTIRAHVGDGLTAEQVGGLAGKALRQIETAWRDLGFDNPSENPDLTTRIMGHADPLSKELLCREFPLYGDKPSPRPAR
jgi:predicted HicB family RNase H-like nuclease